MNQGASQPSLSLAGDGDHGDECDREDREYALKDGVAVGFEVAKGEVGLEL